MPEGAGETGTDDNGTDGTDGGDGTDDGGDGTKTDTACFEAEIPCPSSCQGKCEFRIEFAYDYEFVDRPEGGFSPMEISRFEMTFVEATSGDDNCETEFDYGYGSFEFTADGEDCSLDRDEVRHCECGLVVQREDLDPDDDEDCVCPDWDTDPDCGEPVSFERSGDIEHIAVDYRQNVHCSCGTETVQGSMDVKLNNVDRVLQFGGDYAEC